MTDDAQSRPSLDQRDGESVTASDAASTKIPPGHDTDRADARSPAAQQFTAPPSSTANAPSPETLKHVNGVLASEVSILKPPHKVRSEKQVY